jgi:hypothetical protein
MTSGDERAPRNAYAPDRYDHAAESLLDSIEAACNRRADLADKVEEALRAGLAFLAVNPDLASLLTAEPYEPGKAAALRHQHWLERYGVLLRRAASSEFDAPVHPAFVEPTIVAGISWQISRLVLAARAEQLEQLLPDLLEFTLVFYLGPGEASRIARAPGSS